MKGTLRISSSLALPMEAVTQTFAILAKRGSGKTYTGTVVAEEMIGAELPCTVIDPVGVWWGLRAAANGRDEGLEVLVMGGDHGDVPLERTGGEMVAQFIVEARRPVVLALSLFRKGEQTQFVTDFAETLYRLNRAPMHVFVDEADAFAPQRPMPGEQRLLGAMEDLVRRGRARGIGLTLITQRAAVLNKNVLTQIEVLVCLRTISPQDRAAIEAWIEVHGTQKQRDELMASLPSLPIGTAWFWSPGWLDIFQKVQVRKRHTFDSSATPAAGEKIAAPKKLRAVDLAALREKMAATIETAKANDPRELRKTIEKLRGDVVKLSTANAELADKAVESIQAKQTPALKDGQLARIEKFAAKLDDAATTAAAAAKDVRDVLAKLQPTAANPHRATAPISRPEPRPEPAHKPPAGTPPTADGEITRPMQRILDALATLEVLGLRDVDKSNAAVFADQSPTSSGYSNNLGRLRTLALIHYPQTGRVALSDDGRQRAQINESIRTRDDLHRAWFAKLAAPKVRILEALIRVYPDSIEKPELAKLAAQSWTSSGYSNNLGNLRSLGLIEYPQTGHVVATSLLFPELP